MDYFYCIANLYASVFKLKSFCVLTWRHFSTLTFWPKISRPVTVAMETSFTTFNLSATFCIWVTIAHGTDRRAATYTGASYTERTYRPNTLLYQACTKSLKRFLIMWSGDNKQSYKNSYCDALIKVTYLLTYLLTIDRLMTSLVNAWTVGGKFLSAQMIHSVSAFNGSSLWSQQKFVVVAMGVIPPRHSTSSPRGTIDYQPQSSQA